jgi:hypothetical protein
MSTSYADRSLIVLSAVVALCAVAVRVHDIVAYPALRDFDAAGHALNVVDLVEGHLPNLHSWCGSHPPLYYMIGAALWTLLPEGVPIHVMLRGISVVSWVAAVVLVWRALRRIASDVDAAVVAALLLGVPGILIGSCMMTNDALCALLVTATFVRLLPMPNDPPPTARHAALTGVLGGLAALTKIPGLWAVGLAAVWYAWRSRASIRGALYNLSAFGLIAGGIAALHYGRFFFGFSGSLFDFLTATTSQEKHALVDALLAMPSQQVPRWAVPLLLHAALWADPLQVFLPFEPPVLLAMLALCVAGLGVLGVALLGTARLVARHQVARLGAPLSFSLLVAILLVYAFSKYPNVMEAKPTYVLPTVLPVGLALAFGVGALQRVWGTVLRGALLAVAAGGLGLTWYGWWAAASAAPPRITLGNAAAGSAVQAVERYFRYRADDPIRAQPLLADQLQLAHGLRLTSILGISTAPETGLPPTELRALEAANGRVASMELYNLVRWLQPVAAALAVTVVDANEGGADARVTIRVTAAGSSAPTELNQAVRSEKLPVGDWPFAAFEQLFTLRRSGGEWRITAIEQHGVSEQNAVAALAAAPTLAGLEHIVSLGWKPGWLFLRQRPEPPSA